MSSVPRYASWKVGWLSAWEESPPPCLVALCTRDGRRIHLEHYLLISTLKQTPFWSPLSLLCPHLVILVGTSLVSAPRGLFEMCRCFEWLLSLTSVEKETVIQNGGVSVTVLKLIFSVPRSLVTGSRCSCSPSLHISSVLAPSNEREDIVWYLHIVRIMLQVLGL